MQKTLIILNPHAAGGLAGRLWTQIEPILWETLGELVVAITQRQEEVAQHLDQAYASGLTRVISIGGDGTNHTLINALAHLNERHPDGPQMVYGNLPIGTGRDWARGSGIPINDVEAAARWIAEAQPHPTDIGLLNYDDRREYFLNIASAGITSDIVHRVDKVQRKPWSFLQATVTALFQHRPQQMQIRLDGEMWYEGKAYAVAVANGTTFGHGMKIAPNAQVRDGLFDVILVENASPLSLLAAMPRLYNGTHLTHPAVHAGRAATVQVTSSGQPLGIELDGEPAIGESLTFQVRPGLLQLLGKG